VSNVARIGGPAADLTPSPPSGAAWRRLAAGWSGSGDAAAAFGSSLGTGAGLGGTLGMLGAQGTLAGLSRGALPRGQARAGAFSQALQTASLRTPPLGATGSAAAGRTSAGAVKLLSAGGAGRVAPAAPRVGGAGAGLGTGAGLGAGGRIPAIDQTDAREYDSAGQARLWGGSTCSATALTEVLRSRGVSASIADVMKAMGGGITVAHGLVSRPALVNAAARFGVQAQDNVTSYDALQQATAAGQPVLVDVTNGRFSEGHWLVVTAADQRGVSIVDSSGYHLTSMSRDEFLSSWSKRGIRIMNAAQTPVGTQGAR
jgi:hypothetical protein